MPNWWVDDQGRNNLAGVPGDSDNPPILTDSMIIEFLLTIPAAKAGFREAFPGMLPAEQERLRAIVESNPRTLTVFHDEHRAEEVFQARMNSVPYYDPNRRRA